MKMFLTLGLVVLASTAFARIGETLDECQTRYGVMIGTDMTRSDYPAYVFRKDGIEIRVRLYDGKSAQEIFFGIGTEMKREQLVDIQSDTRGAYMHSGPASNDEIVQMLAALGVKVSRSHPIGINGEEGTSWVLVLQTAEFDNIFPASGRPHQTPKPPSGF